MAQFDGQFLPLTFIFDVNSLQQGEPIDQNRLRELLIRIALAFQQSNLIVNNKQSGSYDLQEIISGNTYFPDPTLDTSTASAPQSRASYFKAIDFGALPNAGLKQVAHDIPITAATKFVGHKSWANDVINNEYIPLPFVNVSGTITAGDIELYIDATNINITTTGDGTNFTECWVIVEYVQD